MADGIFEIFFLFIALLQEFTTKKLQYITKVK